MADLLSTEYCVYESNLTYEPFADHEDRLSDVLLRVFNGKGFTAKHTSQSSDNSLIAVGDGRATTWFWEISPARRGCAAWN